MLNLLVYDLQDEIKLMLNQELNKSHKYEKENIYQTNKLILKNFYYLSKEMPIILVSFKSNIPNTFIISQYLKNIQLSR